MSIVFRYGTAQMQMIEQRGNTLLFQLRSKLTIYLGAVIAKFSANLRNFFNPVPTPPDCFLG